MWFQDEARVGQQGTITRVWAKKGTRPRVIRQQQYDNAYIFGAVCAQQDQAIGLVLPHVTIAAMNLHLQAISDHVPKGRHALVVLDRAGWHTSLKLNTFSNISLLSLPSASPELNPTEQVWQWLRDRKLANRCFDNYDDIVNRCCDAWNTVVHSAGFIKNLCTRQWVNLIT